MSTELRNTFQEIANAIRTKSGTTEPISARNFASSILSLNAGAGAGGSKITVYTLIPECTAVPIDSTTIIENIYFNTSLSEEEVISLIDNAFASVPDWPEELGPMTYVFMSETTDKWMMVMVMVQEGMYFIQAFNKEPTTEEEEEAAVVFIGGPNASEMGAPFTGWNPNFSGELALNETNAYVEMIVSEQG